MNNSIFQDLKNNLSNADNRVNQFIFLNVLLFVILKFIEVIEYLFQLGTNIHYFLIKTLSLPASFSKFIYQPWSIVSNMFLHDGFFHLLFNMLWLYWFGNLIAEYLNKKRFVFLYLAGGIIGGLLFMLSFNLFPAFNSISESAFALGASASIMAIVFASATLLPDYTVLLILIGPVKLKYIAIVYLVIDFISIKDNNAGGHIAHLGGALFGFLFIKSLNNGNDWSKLFDFLSTKNTLKVSYRNDGNVKKKSENNQEEVDKILDKISKSGYESLSQQEKDILFKASK